MSNDIFKKHIEIARPELTMIPAKPITQDTRL